MFFSVIKNKKLVNIGGGFLFLLFFYSSFTCFSQLDAGIKPGLNYVNANNNVIVMKWRASYHAGLTFRYVFTKHSSITSDLFFSDKGFEYPNPDERKMHFLYVTTPVTYRYAFFKKAFIEAGGELGILTSSHWKKGDKKADMSDAFGNGIDVGAMGGIGYMIDRFTLCVRYTHGFVDVHNKEQDLDLQFPNDGAFSINQRYFNKTWQLSLSYTLIGNK